MPVTSHVKRNRKVAETLPLFSDLAHEEVHVNKSNGSTKLLSPPLKWAGGKRWLLPHILPIWGKHLHRRLVEPFCGGLAVTLGLLPKRALLNDINPHLINFYRQLSLGLKLPFKAEDNDKVVFYKNRDRFNELIKTQKGLGREAAQLFYYLNRTCFNGLCRFNKSGLFNVPHGRYNTINYASDFYAYKALFQTWEFSNVDFEKVTIQPDDFIYADPPYDVEFTSYSAGGFSFKDQERLAEWLANQTVPIVLSNQATKKIIGLYTKHGFDLDFYAAPRRISCNGDRRAAKEVLATKNL